MIAGTDMSLPGRDKGKGTEQERVTERIKKIASPRERERMR